MNDIIALIYNYYKLRNLPGFIIKSDIDYKNITKSDFVLKMQSYIFNCNACILKQYNGGVIDYILSLLKRNVDYCLCVNLNYLEFHHVVIDVDFKKFPSVDSKFVKEFCEDISKVVKSILANLLVNNQEIELTLMVKKTLGVPDNTDIFESARNGIHFEIKDLVLYRGDNIWFIEILKKLLNEKYPHLIKQNIIDQPINWNLPLSKKQNKEVYLPVGTYNLSDNIKFWESGKELLINSNFDETFVKEYSVIKNYEPDSVHVYFPLDLLKQSHGYYFGIHTSTNDNTKVYKRSQLALLDTNLGGVITINKQIIPYADFAIFRFYKNNCLIILGESQLEKSLLPFNLAYLREELTVFYNDLTSDSRGKSQAVFNLYVFLIKLYDKVCESDNSFTEEILSEIQNSNLINYFNTISSNIVQLVEETIKPCKDSEKSLRKLNPLLFLKCLFVQSYTDSNKVELIFDDSTDESVYISSNVLSLINNSSLPILELVKLMYPVYATQKDGSIFYYEKNSWCMSLNRLEHAFLPLKILNKYGCNDVEELETDNSSLKKKRKMNKSEESLPKIYTYLIQFWGRVNTIDFPTNVVSFKDGFVLISNEYLIFSHTPLFRGYPSRLSWNDMKRKIRHISNPSCIYNGVFNILNTNIGVKYESSLCPGGIIDYFRYSYTKEIGPKMCINDIEKCNNDEECPVYNSLKYFLTLFLNDIELVFFILWTLRLVLLGVAIKKALIFYGEGQNGKSSLSCVIYALFGKAMCFVGTETIRGKISTLAPDLYNAKDAKIVYADDLQKINPLTLKQIVSGAHMYLRTLYNSGTDVQMKWLFTGSCNSLRLNADFATMKRILIIPFLNFFPDNSEYYCNDATFKNIASDILASIFWLEKHSLETNIFYNDKFDIVYPPKSVKWYSHELIWKNDLTSGILNAFNIIESPSLFIRISDLISEINIMRTSNKFTKFKISILNEDIETIINLLKHRYSIGTCLNKSKRIYEQVIIGISIDRFRALYDEAFELI